MDGMIIAVIVGLLSGALGSVLGPVVVHHLRRRERKEERKEEREREIHSELCQMIEGRLDEHGRNLGVAFIIYTDVRIRKSSPLDAYNHATAKRSEWEKSRPRHRWQPYRIMDSTLRSLTEQLNDRVHDFDSYLVSVMALEFDEWSEGILERERTLGETERQVRLRLDELCW